MHAPHTMHGSMSALLNAYAWEKEIRERSRSEREIRGDQDQRGRPGEIKIREGDQGTSKSERETGGKHTHCVVLWGRGQPYMHAFAHSHAHACTRAYTHACKHMHMRTLTCILTHLHTHTCILTCILTITCMYSHLHTHMHILTVSDGVLLLNRLAACLPREVVHLYMYACVYVCMRIYICMRSNDLQPACLARSWTCIGRQVGTYVV